MRTTQAAPRSANRTVKSGRQRRAEMKARRAEKRVKKCRRVELELQALRLRREAVELKDCVAVSVAHLKPDNSYGAPDFVMRGHYQPKPFACKDCGKADIWTAAQQKWWYETMRGYVWSTAIRCRECRARERARIAAAREASEAGLARKLQRLAAVG